MRHADAVADRRERAGVDDLAREARREPLRHPAGQREAVDHDGGVAIDHLAQLARQAVRMDRHVRRASASARARRACARKLARTVADLVEPGRVLAAPVERRGAWRRRSAGAAPASGSPTTADLGRHVPADARRRRRRPGCSVASSFQVGGSPKCSPLQKSKADGEHHVGAAGERLLPGAAHGQRVILRHAPCAGAARSRPGCCVSSASSRSSAAASDQKTPSPADDQRPLGARAAARRRARSRADRPATRSSSGS